MSQQQNAQGYKLQFNLLGFTAPLSTRTLRVRVTRPDGTSFDRLSADADVVVLDEAKKLVGVRVKVGDLPAVGKYQYQAFDETAGIYLPTGVENFYVDANLVAP